jgi:hypothetical protein
MTHTGKTQVRFVSGMDGVYAQPSVARQVGLGCRFAVVQDSHVEGQDDMVFDEALWRALVDFASRLGDGVEVITQTGRRSRPQPLAAWMEAFEATPADDRSPPELLLVHEGNHLKVCMVTEFWSRVGGPAPYHDSYTYAFFSVQDLGREIVAHLESRNGDGRWALAGEIITVSPGLEPGIIRRVLDWLR